MDALAITKAHSRLRVATKAVDDLSSAKDHSTFADVWYTFLVAAKGVYTVLEQGAKQTAQARQWFGAKSAQRRGDPLLQYLFQARDDDEHGVSPVVEHVPGGLAIGVRKPGFATGIELNGRLGPGGTLNVRSLDGNPVLTEYTPPHVKLIRVHGRDKRPYDPPDKHLGIQLESNLPIPVAQLAIAYLSAMVREAERLT